VRSAPPPQIEAETLRLRADAQPLVRTAGGWLTRLELVAQARTLAAQLPVGAAAVNLCESRANYLVAVLALELRGQTCLMPPSRVAAVVGEVMAEHAGSFTITDAMVANATARSSTDRAPQGAASAAAGGDHDELLLASSRVVMIGYTSGSTGRPKPNAKRWDQFAATTRCNVAALQRAVPATREPARPWIVATVPSQHMYGTEFAVMLPLLAGCGVHAAHPLFPADIAAALGDVPAPRVLVTTPVHLRALLASQVILPAVAAVLSATAPLGAELARDAERRLGTTVIEFFGSTETCVIASRETAREDAWRPYDGVEVRPAAESTLVAAPWFDAPIAMQDVFECRSDGRFTVVGRSADMIEVAGKRASLADLTRRLLGIHGVQDGVILQPDATASPSVRRLAAIVVAPGLAPEMILAELARQCDPVFVPRPLVCVTALPRNEVGKLPRDQLLALLHAHGRRG
jgi:acyl-coenzyme A synthetase/AMP-(fatty) acid ligase